MKYITVFTILLFFLKQNSFSQNYTDLLQGSWIRYKTSSKNDIENKNIDLSYLKLTIKGSNLYFNIDPTIDDLKAPVIFTMKGQLMKTSKISESGYHIEKITSDSLIISDSFDNKAGRYYFVNSEILKKERVDANRLNDTLIADKYFTPIQTKNISHYLHGKIQNNIDRDFYVTGIIKLNLTEKKAETIINSEDINNKKRVSKIIKSLNETYSFWNLNGFEKFKIIEIPFQIIVTKNEMVRALRLDFF